MLVTSTLLLEHTIIDLNDFSEAVVGEEVVIIGKQEDKEITTELSIEE